MSSWVKDLQAEAASNTENDPTGANVWNLDKTLSIEKKQQEIVLINKKIKSYSFNRILLISSMILNAILIAIALFFNNQPIQIILEK